MDEVDDTANRPSVIEFWNRMMKRFGSEETYRRDIVVDMLLQALARGNLDAPGASSITR